ncbi:MAG: class I SAM-dependent methyltransferase [Verrucomicrobia bacterium]|nr:class I SAM-dependent methyltransferase [Verrucomicrobiota bacterium]
MKKALILFLLTVVATLHSHDVQWEIYKSRSLPELSHIDGWCSQDKAQNMMDLIYATHPQICVEIGVFGGSSIYPTAKALAYQKSGVVYAIDPWSKEDCSEGYTPGDPNYEWWNSVDLDKIYRNFIQMLKKHHLQHHCVVMRMTAEQACASFVNETIDILHIDGNHSEESALRDAELYLPKVKRGGYIWFDDVNWRSTTKAIEFLSDYCDEVPEMFANNCVLFRKR